MNATAQALAVPLLRAALHTRVEPPFATDLPDWLDRAALVGHLAGRQLATAITARGNVPQATFVASTLLDPSFSTSAAAVRRFTRAFEAASGQPLGGLVNAYLCAGWGFVLRHALRHTALRDVALCVVDLDVHDIAWRREHPVIGRSGFGFSTLLFELPEARDTLPVCGGPYANSAFTEFVMALRAHRQRHGLTPTFLPFTQPALHGTAERALGAETLARNRYAAWGHCFGSDPWIGLIEWLDGNATDTTDALDAVDDAQRIQRVLAGAIGFNGYYTASAIDVDRRMPRAFEVLQGDALAASHANIFIPPLCRSDASSAGAAFGVAFP